MAELKLIAFEGKGWDAVTVGYWGGLCVFKIVCDVFEWPVVDFYSCFYAVEVVAVFIGYSGD